MAVGNTFGDFRSRAFPDFRQKSPDLSPELRAPLARRMCRGQGPPTFSRGLVRALMVPDVPSAAAGLRYNSLKIGRRRAATLPAGASGLETLTAHQPSATVSLQLTYRRSRKLFVHPRMVKSMQPE